MFPFVISWNVVMMRSRWLNGDVIELCLPWCRPAWINNRFIRNLMQFRLFYLNTEMNTFRNRYFQGKVQFHFEIFIFEQFHFKFKISTFFNFVSMVTFSRIDGTFKGNICCRLKQTRIGVPHKTFISYLKRTGKIHYKISRSCYQWRYFSFG